MRRAAPQAGAAARGGVGAVRSGRSDGQPTRVVLIDTCDTFRHGLRHALSLARGVVVTCECGAPAEAAGYCIRHGFDVAVIDFDLPRPGGIDLCRRIAHVRPEARLLMLGDRDWDVYVAAARAARAHGFLLRRTPMADLVRSIRDARLRPVFTAEQLDRAEAWTQAVGKRLASLSARQWDVLWLMAEGMSNRELASRLGISENTVEKHIGEVYRRLGVQSRAELLALVLEHHLDVFRSPGEGRSGGAPVWWLDSDGSPGGFDLHLTEAAPC